MKLKLLGGVALAAACAASGSWAENGWYGAVDAGAHQAFNIHMSSPSAPNVRFKTENTSAVVFGRIGYRVSPYIPVEIEGGTRPANVKGGSVIQGGADHLCRGCPTL